MLCGDPGEIPYDTEPHENTSDSCVPTLCLAIHLPYILSKTFRLDLLEKAHKQARVPQGMSKDSKIMCDTPAFSHIIFSWFDTAMKYLLLLLI